MYNPRNREERKKYDMMTIIMIHLSGLYECRETNIIRLLNTLMSNQKTYEEKIDIFEKEYGIKTNDSIRGRVKSL